MLGLLILLSNHLFSFKGVLLTLRTLLRAAVSNCEDGPLALAVYLRHYQGLLIHILF